MEPENEIKLIGLTFSFLRFWGRFWGRVTLGHSPYAVRSFLTRPL